MVKVTLRIHGEDERTQYMPKKQALEFRLKLQFQLLLKSVYMQATDTSETQFRLIKNNEIIGYFFMEPID